MKLLATDGHRCLEILAQPVLYYPFAYFVYFVVRNRFNREIHKIRERASLQHSTFILHHSGWGCGFAHPRGKTRTHQKVSSVQLSVTPQPPDARGIKIPFH